MMSLCSKHHNDFETNRELAMKTKITCSIITTGMNSFMNVRLTGALNDQVNFKTFANAMFLLFRLATSAGWNDVLDPLMNTRDCTPSDGVNVGDCGDPVLAVIYFVAFIFLAFLGKYLWDKSLRSLSCTTFF